MLLFNKQMLNSYPKYCEQNMQFIIFLAIILMFSYFLQLRVIVKGYSAEFGLITHEHTDHIRQVCDTKLDTVNGMSADDVKQLKCMLEHIAKELDEGCDSLLGSFSMMVKSCQSFKIESELESRSQAIRFDGE